MESNALSIQNLCKTYDGFSLKNVSFDVPQGSIMGFIGQNGAGKTTTIKAILNIIKKDSGSIEIFGLDHINEEKKIKENIAAVFDEIPFPEDFHAKNINKIMRGIYRQWNEKTFYEYLERFGIPEKKKISKLSKGMKMKLQIATALSHNAKFLIMDEATTGLDPVVRNEILDIFFDYIQDEEHTILMSSHITSDLERIADSITLIDNGEILLSGYKDDLLEQHAILKCSKNTYQMIDKQDIISEKITAFGVEALVHDKKSCIKKYQDNGVIFDSASLEDIMLFYVKRSNGL